LRRDLPNISAALNPALLPPTIIASNIIISLIDTWYQLEMAGIKFLTIEI
jgi:hypothetical protein